MSPGKGRGGRPSRSTNSNSRTGGNTASGRPQAGPLRRFSSWAKQNQEVITALASLGSLGVAAVTLWQVVSD